MSLLSAGRQTTDGDAFGTAALLLGGGFLVANRGRIGRRRLHGGVALEEHEHQRGERSKEKSPQKDAPSAQRREPERKTDGTKGDTRHSYTELHFVGRKVVGAAGKIWRQQRDARPAFTTVGGDTPATLYAGRP